MSECEVLRPRWDGPCIVAATGKSLTEEVAAACRGHHVIAVKQAWMRFKWADVLYACDGWWWDHYKGVPEFAGEKWSSHETSINNKLETAKKYGLRLVKGRREPGFSEDPSVIHYGFNSGFQAIGLAIHWLRGPRKRIILVGFDMGGSYFYGQHPRGPHNGQQWAHFIPHFERAAAMLPENIEIVNCTKGSALKCFKMAELADVLTSPTT